MKVLICLIIAVYIILKKVKLFLDSGSRYAIFLSALNSIFCPLNALEDVHFWSVLLFYHHKFVEIQAWLRVINFMYSNIYSFSIQTCHVVLLHSKCLVTFLGEKKEMFSSINLEC